MRSELGCAQRSADGADPFHWRCGEVSRCPHAASLAGRQSEREPQSTLITGPATRPVRGARVTLWVSTMDFLSGRE